MGLSNLVFLGALFTRVLLGTATGDIRSSYHLVNSTPVVVVEGELAHSKGRTLVSNNYTLCSAVILDYGEGAVMAHALPTDLMPQVNFVRVSNVVDRLAGELRQKGLDPRRTTAFVHAGSQRDLVSITSDLACNGISIGVAQYDEPIRFQRSRSIFYDPLSDIATVTYYDLDSHRAIKTVSF